MRIAIVKLSALGDIIHAMVVLQFIKQSNSEITIDWILEESFKDLLNSHPHINKLHLVDLKKAKKKKSILILFNEFKKLRNLEPYDLVIDMQGLIKSALISHLIPSTFTLGFDRSSIRERVASFLYNKTFQCEYSKNIIERNISLIEYALGIKISQQQIINKIPFVYPRQKYLITELSTTKKNILIIPGASYKSKCYPVLNWSQLINLKNANFLIIWGNEKEKIMAEQIQFLSPSVNILKKLSLGELISTISQVDIVIGPDTGPTHLAWALNIASITLFGPTPGYRNTYETKINKVIESKSRVDPSRIDKNDYSIKEIIPSEIIKSLNHIIKYKL
jgi:heptosyltransferase I